MTRSDTKRENARANTLTARRMFLEDAEAHPELAGRPKEILRLYTMPRLHEFATDRPRYKHLVGRTEPYNIETVINWIHGSVASTTSFAPGELSDLMPDTSRTRKATPKPIDVIEINDRLSALAEELGKVAAQVRVIYNSLIGPLPGGKISGGNE